MIRSVIFSTIVPYIKFSLFFSGKAFITNKLIQKSKKAEREMSKALKETMKETKKANQKSKKNAQDDKSKKESLKQKQKVPIQKEKSSKSISKKAGQKMTEYKEEKIRETQKELSNQKDESKEISAQTSEKAEFEEKENDFDRDKNSFDFKYFDKRKDQESEKDLEDLNVTIEKSDKKENKLSLQISPIFRISKKRLPTIPKYLQRKQIVNQVKMKFPDPISPQLEAYMCILDDLKDKNIFWCSCGLSRSQPFCDNSHLGTPFTPIKCEIKSSNSTLKLCGCKFSLTKPFCDNTTCISLKSQKEFKYPKEVYKDLSLRNTSNIPNLNLNRNILSQQENSKEKGSGISEKLPLEINIDKIENSNINNSESKEKVNVKINE